MRHSILDLDVLECRSKHASVKFWAEIAAIPERRNSNKKESRTVVCEVNQEGWLETMEQGSFAGWWL